MEEGTKKVLMIVVFIVCLAAAVFLFMKFGGGSGDIPHEAYAEMQLVLCRNPECGASYEMTTAEYIERMRERPVGPETPALICKECGEASVYKAIKCPKCGAIFEYGSLRPADKCPECGYSEMEERRKR